MIIAICTSQNNVIPNKCQVNLLKSCSGWIQVLGIAFIYTYFPKKDTLKEVSPDIILRTHICICTYALRTHIIVKFTMALSVVFYIPGFPGVSYRHPGSHLEIHHLDWVWLLRKKIDEFPKKVHQFSIQTAPSGLIWKDRCVNDVLKSHDFGFMYTLVRSGSKPHHNTSQQDSM